jgi:hypothetical protein
MVSVISLGWFMMPLTSVTLQQLLLLPAKGLHSFELVQGFCLHSVQSLKQAILREDLGAEEGVKMYPATGLINVLLSCWLYVLWFFNYILCIGSCRLQLLE